MRGIYVYEEAWVYYMMFPIIIATVLIVFYVITSQSSNPFGTAKQRAAARDPDKRRMWLTFENKNASAWSFINEIRSTKTHVLLFDELDNSEWYLILLTPCNTWILAREVFDCGKGI